MVSKGKPSPRSAVKLLSSAQVERLAREHDLVDPTKNMPMRAWEEAHHVPEREPDRAEINEQNPRATAWLLGGTSWVMRMSCKLKAWGLEHVPSSGVFITAATHVTQFDVFVPMMSLFHMGRRPRYMAKAEMAHWPIIGKWFRLVGMQPVPRRSGKAKAIEQESIRIVTAGRPLTIWPEGTVTRDPQKWPMSMKSGVGVVALESSRRLGYQVPLFCAVTWGAASINHWFPFPRKNVVMCYDERLDYADLLEHMDEWGEEPPLELAQELADRVRRRMEVIMADIRGEEPPEAGYFDYHTMTRKPRESQKLCAPQELHELQDQQALHESHGLGELSKPDTAEQATPPRVPQRKSE